MSELESLALLIANLNTNIRVLQDEGQKMAQENSELQSQNRALVEELSTVREGKSEAPM